MIAVWFKHIFGVKNSEKLNKSGLNYLKQIFGSYQSLQSHLIFLNLPDLLCMCKYRIQKWSNEWSKSFMEWSIRFRVCMRACVWLICVRDAVSVYLCRCVYAMYPFMFSVFVDIHKTVLCFLYFTNAYTQNTILHHYHQCSDYTVNKRHTNSENYFLHKKNKKQVNKFKEERKMLLTMKKSAFSSGVNGFFRFSLCALCVDTIFRTIKIFFFCFKSFINLLCTTLSFKSIKCLYSKTESNQKLINRPK